MQITTSDHGRKRARILMLSWEYPPVVVGGLGRHVHALSTALVRAGHEVTVVTRHAPGAPLEEYAEGVRIVRAPEDPPLFPLDPENMLAWTMAFNHTLTRSALRAAENGETRMRWPALMFMPETLTSRCAVRIVHCAVVQMRSISSMAIGTFLSRSARTAAN